MYVLSSPFSINVFTKCPRRRMFVILLLITNTSQLGYHFVAPILINCYMVLEQNPAVLRSRGKTLRRTQNGKQSE